VSPFLLSLELSCRESFAHHEGSPLRIQPSRTGRVLSFKLGQYKTINGEEYGILTNSLIVNVPGAKESNSGLEGITFDPLTNHFILANEKVFFFPSLLCLKTTLFLISHSFNRSPE